VIAPPTLEVERGLVSAGQLLACVDEVGRGALAGPVSVGLVVIDPHAVPVLEGVRDSKDLRPAARGALVPQVLAWATAAAVGHASPAEIDEHGIVTALRLAGWRAWHTACASLEGLLPARVLLDGSHDWFTAPPADLFGEPDAADALGLAPVTTPVITRVKADRDCLGVGAASVLAKVERDGMMVDLDAQYPDYGWASNKGYGSAVHKEALRRLGPSEHHRVSWHLL